MSQNNAVAARFEELADFLEAQDVAYKPQAYRTAAANIRDYPAAVETLAAEELTEIEGVGDAIGEKIVEYVDTGEIEALEDEREELPVDMPALTAVEGVGPKTVSALHEALGIETLDELEAACEAGEVQTVSGFGAKTESNILNSIPFARQAGARELLGNARPLAESVIAHLNGLEETGRVKPAGSLRRWAPTIGDVDVLAETTAHETVIDAFGAWERATDVIESGSEKASIRVEDVRVDLRIVQPEEFGAAIQYFTGGREHNIRLRNHAIERDCKVNEYGVFDVSDVQNPDAGQRVGERVAGETEADVYEALGLPWIPPELREDTGEIDAAADGALPELLSEAAIRGDLHTHTQASDGRTTIEELAAAAQSRGDDYLGITDHAAGPGIVGGMGLTPAEIEAQIDDIRVAEETVEIDLFAGIEANIDADGAIGLGRSVLERLDLVVASPHSALDADSETATARLRSAIEHPEVDVIGHPTGRLLNERPGLDLDIEALANAAAEHGTALEINANPHRLDLEGGPVRTAIEAGATIAISTDAHGPGGLDTMQYGAHTARRGWAESGDVLNAWPSDELRSFLE